DNEHSVKVAFAQVGDAGNRYFEGNVDRVVFGAAEYQWHPDPAAAEPEPPAGRGGGRGRQMNGHPDPDGPAAKSSVAASGPDTMFQLPKASIIVLRGRIR